MGLAEKKKKIFDGRYEILEIVGRGACSVVYHARHAMSSSSEVGLKVLLNQKGGTPNTDKLRKEALAMVSSRHRYVVRLDDFHSVKDLCYLSMEYAAEGDLRKYRAKFGGKIPLPQAEKFFLQVAEALNFVHRVGIVHRDIKPDNILVMNENETRLTDFGVAVLPGEIASFDELRSGVGTMSYMAPEVLEGTRCDKLSDIYSLGVSFYEMISGVHPFDNAPLIQQLDVRKDEALTHISKLVPEVPAHIAEAIMKAMRYDPAQRFQSLSELLKILTQANDQNKDSTTIASQENSAGFPIPSESTQAPSNITATPPEIKVYPYPAEDKPESSDSSNANNDPFATTQSESTELENSDTPNEISPITDKIDDEIIEDIPSPINKDLDSPSYSNRERKRKEGLRDKPLLIPPNQAQHAPWLFNVFLIVLILFAGNYLLSKIFGIDLFTGNEEIQKIETTQVNGNLIPAVSEEITSFPNLPEGMYQGTFENFLGLKEVSIFFISLPKQEKLIVILGLEGWTPDVLFIGQSTPETPSALKGNKLRVSSNGLVLDMVGEISEGSVVGKYLETVTGEQGSWHVTPLK
jgi:serine/threonine protein kinase